MFEIFWIWLMTPFRRNPPPKMSNFKRGYKNDMWRSG